MSKKRVDNNLDTETWVETDDPETPTPEPGEAAVTPGEAARYTAKTLLWSFQHERFVEPGEVVEFDLSESTEYRPDIGILLEMGAIEPYTGVWPVPPPIDETITI
jgi:hypothetical protein